MKKIFFLAFIIISITSKAQNYNLFVTNTPQNSFMLDFPLVDWNYWEYAAKTVSTNKDCPDCNLKAKDYFEAYANPSMKQSLNMTANLYSTAHYSVEQIFRDKSSCLGRTLYLSCLALTDFVLTYAPLGDGWLHEEYHRAVLTSRYTQSFNDMNKFPIGAEFISVNHVKDDDLIRMKSDNYADFARMSAAGIEGQYLLVDKLQRQNFFYRQNLPHLFTYWMDVTNSIYYVMYCSQKDANKDTDDFNEVENDIKKRDFTGLDFSAWTYDLFRADEPYTERGIHPLGNGVDRYIKPSDLTSAEKKYLRKQGYIQLVNVLSPMMFGIDFLTCKRGNHYNFAVRHYLTSFGTDISMNVFFQSKKHNLVLIYHHYQNYKGHFPGLEAELVDFPISFGKLKLNFDFRTMTWMQPDKQKFRYTNAKLGGLFGLKTYLSINDKVQPYFEITGKTEGWVAGEVFTEAHLGGLFGCRILFNKKDKQNQDDKIIFY